MLQYIGRSRPCYLCGNFADTYESLPPAGHKTKRADFLDRVILSAPTYKDRVQVGFAVIFSIINY